MPSANGHSPKRAVLYARVSTEEQAHTGYSLAQQLAALRAYAAAEGFEVLEEVSDPGQSGASLERPGMDRVRDLVAAGGVAVVLAQDRDRLAREPAYHYLLKKEFEERGAKVRALNDRGDESPEGELTDGILDQLAKFERAKTTERTRRGKLRKAQEGKLLRNSRAHYGFEFNETGDGYIVNEEEMAVAERVFRGVCEGMSLNGMKRSLERSGVSPPGNNTQERVSRYWNSTYIRRLIDSDVYRPHTFEEVEALVSPGVAAQLDKSACYGIYWFNRRRITYKTVRKRSENGSEYVEHRSGHSNSREKWVAIPVPDSGIPRHVVDTAREVVSHNKAPSKAGRRFWQIPRGAVRCAECGTAMQLCAAQAGGHVYAYYKCSRLARFGKDACCPDRSRTNHRAQEIEEGVWGVVSALLKDPEKLRAGLDEMIEQQKAEARGDPDREVKVWLHKLSEVEEERRGYIRLAAKGRITDEDLDQELAELEETRATAERELEALRDRKGQIEALEADRAALLESYARIVPEQIDLLTDEERHHVYKMLRLEVFVDPHSAVSIRGVLSEGGMFNNDECVPR